MVYENGKPVQNRGYHLYLLFKNTFVFLASDLALRVKTDLGRKIFDFYVPIQLLFLVSTQLTYSVLFEYVSGGNVYMW